MKFTKCFIAVAFAFALSTELRAAAPLVYLSQTNTFSVNPTTTLNWNKFDSSLGTLTGITFVANAVISGSFTVINQDVANEMTASDSNARYRFVFGAGAGTPGTIFSNYLQPIVTTPSTDSTGTVIGPDFASQVFSINGSQSYDSITKDWFSSSAGYFTGIGTVSSTVAQFVNITSTGSNYNLNSNATKTDGSAILTYIYQVPEPSSASLLIFGLGGLVALRRVGRRAV